MSQGQGYLHLSDETGGLELRAVHQQQQQASVPASAEAGHLMHGHMLNNYRDPDSGDRLVGHASCGWILWFAGVGLGIAILVLLSMHYGRTLKDGKKLDTIADLIGGLNTSVCPSCPSCPACNPILNVTINNTTTECTNDTIDVVYCDLIVAGAGPAGVYATYRLGPHFTVCLIDMRDRIGGKVYSHTGPAGITPTHAEQLRASDVIGRCWYQELGQHSWIRGTVGTYLEGFTRGRNWTAAVCNDETMPPANPPVCDWGNPYERVAPNGDLDPATFYQLQNPCGADPWTDCSYEDHYLGTLDGTSPTDDITWQQHVINTLGHEGFSYLYDTEAESDIWSHPHSAKYIHDYFAFDGTQGYSALYVPDGGPYSALELAMTHILGNDTRLFLGEKVLEIKDVTSTDAVNNMEVITTLHRFRAPRVIFAAPPYFVKGLSGDMGGSMANDPHTTFGMHTNACTWNAFFETKWWNPTRSQCINGYCAFADDFIISDAQRAGITWSFFDESEYSPIEFIQYLPTPERDASNLLRVWVKPDYCALVQEILDNQGQAAVSTYLLNYMHSRFDGNGTTVSDVADAYFSSEPSSYSGLRVGVTFDYAEQADYAKRPFVGRRLCLASEGYSTEHAGWQEGAWRSVHRCFREQYLDTFTEEEIVSWETCCRSDEFSHCGSACTSSSGSSSSDTLLTGCIAIDDPDTWSYCNRMDTEESLRDLYEYCYCEACANRQAPDGSSSSSTGPTTHPDFVPDTTERPLGRVGRHVWE